MRFSMRDLFWGTALVAIGLAWWMDNQTKKAAVGQAHRLHSSLSHAKQWQDHWGYFSLSATRPPMPTTQPDWAVLEEKLVEP